MVTGGTTDGKRIAELLSSEIHGHQRGSLGQLSVVDADTDVEPTEAGAFGYAVECSVGGVDGTDDGGVEQARIAEVYVHPDRARVEFAEEVETAADAAEDEGLRVRPKAVDPPRTLVFVESGAEVKDALRVVRAVADESLESGGEL